MGTWVAGDVSSGTTSLTDLAGLAWPAHGADDLALFLLAFGDSVTTLNSFEAGFTSVSQDLDTNVRSLVAKRIPSVMTGSESGSIDANESVGNRQSGALGIWNGYTDVQQIVTQAETSGTAVATHACPAITPQVAGSGFVLLYVERVTSTVTPASTPTGFTKRQEFSTGGTGGTSVVIYDDLSGTHGLTPFTPASIVSQVASTSARVYLLELAPSGLSITFGLALETDAAQALASSKLATLSVATETDSAVAISAAKAVALSLTTEADTALALSASKAALLGVSAEADTALAVAVSKAVALGVATEADTALALTATKSVTLGVATESDTALPLAASRGPSVLATAVETDSALAISATKLVTLGVATETDTALPVSISSIVGVQFPVATETDTALALTASKQVMLGVATEDDTAIALGGSKIATLATATEIDTAFALIVGIGPPPEPGHLVASASQSLTAADASSVLTATTEPTSRLEARDGI